ncbi:hypothetical protein [Phocaeicola sp.]
MKLLHLGRYMESIRQDIIYQNRRNRLTDLALHSTQIGISSERYCKEEIIVSLTTYGKRLYDVYLTIESIMQQSMKANRIVLWLGEDLRNKPLPRILLLQQQRGLEISFCKDIRSYTKLVPALCKFPDDIIITVDDDAVYEFDLLEKLIIAYQEDPSFIYCHRCHRMIVEDDGKLKPYNDWIWTTEDLMHNALYFPTGVGGILYPPHSLDEEVLNEDVFLRICPQADDVWFKAMALKKGTLSRKVQSRNINGEDYIVNEGVQDVGLCRSNVLGEALNDKQIKAVFERYDLYQYLII